MTSPNLIWHLTKEANTIALEDSINKSNSMMIAAISKTKNEKGKNKSKTKEKLTAQTSFAIKMDRPPKIVMQRAEKKKKRL